MALLFKSDSDRIEWWRRELGERMPEVEVRCWPEVGDPKEIEFALVWNMPKGALARFPNLRVIFSLGAGVDHLFADPELPKQVPICRAVDEFLTQRMSEYVALHVCATTGASPSSRSCSAAANGRSSTRRPPPSAGSASWGSER